MLCVLIFLILLQVGSADHHIHYYDLRNISRPVHVFSGHKKAVSYVKFLSNDELASASTDSTLRLWDVKENIPVSNLTKIVYCLEFDYCSISPSLILHLICRFLLALIAYFKYYVCLLEVMCLPIIYFENLNSTNSLRQVSLEYCLISLKN